MNNETISHKETLIRDRILVLFVDLNELSSILRNKILSNAPGAINAPFLEFKKGMCELYGLSSRYDKINPDIKCNVKLWMNSQNEITGQYIMNSIDLFDKYSDELFKKEIIKL